MNKRLAKDMAESRYGCTKPAILDNCVYEIDRIIEMFREAYPYGSKELNEQHREIISGLRSIRKQSKYLWRQVCRESWRSRIG
jgi:hypothetical protein